MKRTLPLMILVTAVLALMAPRPSEGCIAIPRRPDDSALEMSLPQQRAFLYRTGETEHLILSVNYNGATEEFAWVIPTETRAHVDVQEGAPFRELQRLTELRDPFVKNPAMRAGSARETSKASVKVLERKQVGPYDIAVLQATDSGGLYQWLTRNGFGLNQSTRNALDSYVDLGWHFVAARIRPEARAVAEKQLRRGTIAPLHISYRAKQLSYPLRVTAGNPGISEIELFVMSEQPTRQAGLQADTFQLTPRGQTGFQVDGPPTRVVREGDFPTLRKLLPKGGTLTRYTGRMRAADRRRDLVFDRLASNDSPPKPDPNGWAVPDY